MSVRTRTIAGLMIGLCVATGTTLTSQAETLQPPFSNVQGFQAVNDEINIGFAWAKNGSSIELEEGRIHNVGVVGSVYAGMNGQEVEADILGTFVVPSAGLYTVYFEGEVRVIGSTVGETLAKASAQGGAFRSWMQADILNVQLDGQFPPEAYGTYDTLYESDLSLRAFIAKTTWDVGLASLKAVKGVKEIAEVAGWVVDAAQTVDDGFDTVHRGFSMSAQAHLEAGVSYAWRLATHSRMATMSVNIAGCMSTAIIDANLYQVRIAKVPTDVNTVTAVSGDHGQIDPNGAVYIQKGTDATFHGVPDSGYVVDCWYVDGQAQGGGSDSLTISNVVSDRGVLVTFKPDIARGSLTHNGPWSVDAGQKFDVGGYVRDQSGNAVNGVTVYARINGSIVGWAATNASGNYSISGIPAPGASGDYTVSLQATYGGQSITSSAALNVLPVDTDVHAISNADEFLNWVTNAANYNKKFKLAAPIDLSGRTFSTAVATFGGKAFIGRFDGRDFEISGITINGSCPACRGNSTCGRVTGDDSTPRPPACQGYGSEH